MDTKNKVFVVIGSVALLATAGFGGAYLFGARDATNTTLASSSTASNKPVSTSSEATASSPAATTSNTSDTSTASSSSSYKDGTYTASTNYAVPHGETNTVSATVVISGGTIASITTNNQYTDHESRMWISGFESSVSSEVNGSTLDTTSYSRIGGASLTTAAFDDVLDQIASQAKA